MPRGRSPRHQAPPARAGLPRDRRAARPGVRARIRVERADPDPRRPRPAADRGRAARARRALPGHDADHRPRRHRRHGAPRARRWPGAGASSSTRHLEPGRPARLLPPGAARAGRLRLGLSLRPAADVAPHRGQDCAARRLQRGAAARILGGTAGLLADGKELPEPTRPLGNDDLSQSLQLARIHQYLAMATPLLWMRQPDTMGVLGLAINTCAERERNAETADRILELLVAARDLWAAAATSRTSTSACWRSGSASG